MEVAIAFIILALLIGVSYYAARRRELTCPECKKMNCKKTGNRKVIERKRRALIAGPLPHYDYEYECKRCGHLFWSPIESLWGN